MSEQWRRSFKWPAGPWYAFIGLAATRIVVLAHWPSGAAAGFIQGLLVERKHPADQAFSPSEAIAGTNVHQLQPMNRQASKLGASFAIAST